MSDESPDTERFVEEGALPTPPAPPLADGQEVAVALWRDDDLAALLLIAHNSREDEPFEQYIDISTERATIGSSTRPAALTGQWPTARGR